MTVNPPNREWLNVSLVTLDLEEESQYSQCLSSFHSRSETIWLRTTSYVHRGRNL